MKFESVSSSERGLVRKENEDSVLVQSERGLYVVADGMGGGEEGARASHVVCAELERQVTAARYQDRLDQIRAGIAASNLKIGDYVRQKGLRQMGSTVALLVFDTDHPSRAAIAYIGDSRVYRLRADRAELLTRDHSVGAELEERVGKRLGADFAKRANPLAHVLTRAIGTAPSVEIEWRKLDVCAGDRYLVCSDGVHDVISTDDLSSLVAAADLKTAQRQLTQEILKRGAPDNFSFVLINAGERQ